MAFTYPKAPQPMVESRGDEFGLGVNPMEMPSRANMNSLAMQSAQENSETPRTVAPRILAPNLPTGNGLGTSDQDRQLIGGGLLPTSNGQSAGNWQQSLMFNDRRNV